MRDPRDAPPAGARPDPNPPVKPPGRRSGEGLQSVLEHLRSDPLREPRDQPAPVQARHPR